MYINVLVEIVNKKLDRTFTYHVPNTLVDDIEVGKRVEVPFGKLTLEGFIMELNVKPDIEDIKDIIRIVDEKSILNEEMLDLGKWLKETTISSLCSCYQAMLPKALKASHKTNINKKYVTYIKLETDYESALELASSSSQKEIINLFKDNNIILKKVANQKSSSATKTLLKNKIISEYEEEINRYLITNEIVSDIHELNDTQQKAFNTIKEYLNTNTTILLHGITGSGKTEVYLHLIKEVLKMGKTSLVLVPEISLTPQFIERFNSSFEGEIAILHSGLSDREKYDEWRKIINNKAKIVIGARSAIFAPLTNLGIIILDEEQSSSYKQDVNPKYDAIKVAMKRSETHNCPLILGSATPKLSHIARSSKGLFKYVSMDKRVNNKELPKVTLIDMRKEKNHNILSSELEYKIMEKLEKNEQVLLLLNRRGYSRIVTCSSCGFIYKCPYCDISLTFHKSSNSIRCHYCGYTKYIDNKCPSCKNDSLNYLGLGTEKLESYLEEVFPRASIVRMDSDTTTKKDSYKKIVNDFYNHKYDILLGTQMISKGLDFPNVSLVGIINADDALNMPLYNAREESFNLLHQASGRAGRSSITGEVIIQTYNPTNDVLECIKNNDFKGFVRKEMQIRKTLKYPPYYFLSKLVIKSKDYKEGSTESKKVKEYLERNLSKDSIILGPAIASIFMVNKIYHYEILIKYRKEPNLSKTLLEIDNMYKLNKNVTIDFSFEE